MHAKYDRLTVTLPYPCDFLSCSKNSLKVLLILNKIYKTISKSSLENRTMHVKYPSHNMNVFSSLF